MAMNRVQFQPGMSMSTFFVLYGSEPQCEAALVVARWPQGFVCPHCSGTAHCVLRVRHRQTFQCLSCWQQTTIIAGTLFHSTKLALRTWFLALYLLGQAKANLSALSLMRSLGVSYPTAWLIKHKVMQSMLEREALYTLDGRVEVDDAYLGVDAYSTRDRIADIGRRNLHGPCHRHHGGPDQLGLPAAMHLESWTALPQPRCSPSSRKSRDASSSLSSLMARSK